MMIVTFCVQIALYSSMDSNSETRRVGFSVDAGLIQRLGYELVGRAETAVSELIKNSYDADASAETVKEYNDHCKS